MGRGGRLATVLPLSADLNGFGRKPIELRIFCLREKFSFLGANAMRHCQTKHVHLGAEPIGVRKFLPIDTAPHQLRPMAKKS